ncbi:MAG: right-handed parallel beta-helix repeat-containing protein [Bacteroidetes bacterium]|nr:right-handed parallel beta-helix repeat-containing protein [Bacteroidota bacterium]
MKPLLLFLSMVLCKVAFSTVYYISPSGSDATGTGTITNPWKTLYKATFTVTTPGDIIHVTAGTYVETQQCQLSVGVSIEGDGVTSVLKSALTADWTEMLGLHSPEGTNGNQHISNLKFDGQSLSTFWGIYIGGRSNVSIHDITMVDFKDRGIIFGGRNDGNGAPPTIYATGNSFYNNIVDNCGAYDLPTGQYGRGCLNIGGQIGMLIYNNTISQTSRPIGFNGWPIKGWNEGYLKGCKIYNNILNKIPMSQSAGFNGWNFAIELFNESGLEIYGNTITGGSIDLNFQTKDIYPYSVWIHDNVIRQTVVNTWIESGMVLEYGTDGAIIENNTIDKVGHGIQFNTRSGNTVSNVLIQKNLITNVTMSEGTGGFIGVFSDGSNNYNINNFTIYNNTLIASGTPPWWGVNFGALNVGTAKNITIKNNIINNILSGWLVQGGNNAMDSVTIQYNDTYNNGNSNNPVFNGVPPTHYVTSNMIHVNPLFVSSTDFHLQATSPCIDAGTNVGLAFNGANPDLGYAETGVVNIPPTANAGPDQTITLPASSISLAGSGTDPDGTITAYLWTKISGPASGTIVSPASANTAVTGFSIAGTYKYELKVTDNNGATGRDTMILTVNPDPNLPPVANAGPDQLITLPTNSVTLSGSGTDPDGTVTAYLWTKISGPAAGTITTPAAASTTITGMAGGIYKFELKVTDNNGAVGRDTIQVTVNTPPTANAGADQVITLPVNVTTLTGSATDPDGTVTAYLWTKISGPAAGTIVTPAAVATSVTGLAAGIYKFELKVTDNNGGIGRDTMQVLVNIPPLVNAGPDQNITLPTNSVSLSGSATDADGTVTAYLWTKISGPASGIITTPTAAATTVTGMVAGIYKFELKATDNNGGAGRDTMQVTVNPGANIPPTANAGADQVITLPTNSTTLTGSGTDPDGTITAYAWTKISGPAAGSITNPAAAATTVTGMVQGVYLFELKVTDNNGATGKDTMQVTVNPAPNIPPVANAGVNQVITLPVNSTTLAGSGIDPDGTITAFHWAQISGPAAATITNPAAANTTVTNMVAGTYKFELTVTDNNGATGKDTMQVIVNRAPAANAGPDQLISLPVNTVNLSGSGSDPDGTITAYAWTKISGPSAGTISNPASANTAVTGLVAGIYKFELKVTDNNGAVARDTMQVTVNMPPVVNAGPDQTLTLPNNSINLAGSATDADGSVISYSWSIIAGPIGGGTITNPTSPATTVTGLVAGIYKFELTAADNNGALGKDTMQLTVFAQNIPPTANAGLNQSITLPTNFADLTGSGSDPDGFIISYRWTQISGPAAGTFTNANAAVTQVMGLVAGTYQFELTVTDNSGATATDVVTVTVNPANLPPTANAGPDLFVVLPSSSVLLNGSGTDPDGVIAGYTWKQIAGPPGKLISPNSAVTDLQSLIVVGQYQFELTVTDNKGAFDKDTVNVSVTQPVIPNQDEIKVYPNPVLTTTTLDMNLTIPTSTVLVTITDMQGKTVYKKKVATTTYRTREPLDMSMLARGTYLVTVYLDATNKKTIPVIKQ